MTKNSKGQRQEDEMKILAALQNNSNENIETIAKHFGFSKQKVWKMIKQMEERHMIWGYTAIVDAETQGFQKFMLLIKRSQKILDIKNMDEIAYERLGKIISNLEVTIESSYYIHGEYDWILIFLAKDIQHAKKFADILYGAYPGIVDKANLSQILYTQRDHRIENPNQSKLREFL